MRENQKARSPSRNVSKISLGDIVILKDGSTKRAFWKVAVVESLLTGKDGEVRATVVRVGKSEGSPLLLRRSVKHLYPLEVSSAENFDNAVTSDCETTIQDKTTEQTGPDKASNTGRKRRTAAVAGELRRRLSMFN